MTPDTIARDFKGIWIPKELWLHPGLTIIQKALIAEIDSLDDSTGCYASNEYLAQMFNVTEAGMANLISKIRKLGLIEDVSFNGRERRIRVNPSVKSALTQLGERSINHPMKSYRDRDKRREKEPTLPDLLGGEGGPGAPKIFPNDLLHFPKLREQPGFIEAWRNFVADRKERRKPVTSRAAKMILEELVKRPTDAAEALLLAIKRRWQGFEWEWFDRAKGKQLVSPAIRHSTMPSLAEQRRARR